MKKILCLLLAAVMIFGLVACGGDKTPSNPTERPSTNNSTEDIDGTTPNGTQSEGTTPEETDGTWVIKEDLAQPGFVTPKKVTDDVHFTQGDAFFTMNLYQAAWSQINPEDVMNQLKQLPIFDGWTWSIEREEKGYGKIYTDVGEHRNFEYDVSVIAEKPVDYITHRVSVRFTAQTNEYSGWRGISVNYSTPNEDTSVAHQEFILPVLQVVYGNAAEYMLYAPETDSRYSEMALTGDNEFGYEKVGRKLSDNSVYFSLYAYTKLENSWEEYAGAYEPMLKDNAPEYYDEIFTNFDSMNFNSVEKIGSKFLGKYLKNYEHTAPGNYDTLYTYVVTEYENGDKDIEFAADLLVYQKDASRIEGMTLELRYNVEVRAGVMTVKNVEIHMPALCEEWDNNDPEDTTVIKRLNENLTYAKQVANAVFGTNFEFSEVHWNGGSDYKLRDSYKTEMFGREVTVSFDFSTKTMDSIGANRASFTINIY